MLKAADYAADALDVWTHPGQIFSGENATVYATFKNLSSAGEGTFDIRIVVTDPGSRTTEYAAYNLSPNGDNSVFSSNQQRTFNFSRSFSDTGSYTIRAEIWYSGAHDQYTNPDWYRFDYKTTTITVTEAPDTTPPSNPTSFSGSDPINTWTQDNDLYVKWSGASDNKGLKRYYYKWTTSSSSSVGSSDSYTTSSSGSGSKSKNGVSDGDWYFHIRYVDTNNNWASSTKHYGPFRIDRTPPSVDDLKYPISSQRITDTTPNFDWDGFSDSRSGIDEYEIHVETDTLGRNRIGPKKTGSSSSSYTASSGEALEAGGEGYDWRVRAWDNAGNSSAWTSWERFYVDDPFLVSSVSVSLNKSNATTGETYTRSATINGSGNGQVSYRWEHKEPGGSWEALLTKTVTMNNGSASVGATQYNVPASEGTHQFRIVVTSPNSETSNTASLSVYEPTGYALFSVYDTLGGASVGNASLYIYDENWENPVEHTTIAGSALTLELKAGVHPFEVKKDGDYWGAGSVTVNADATTPVSFTRNTPVFTDLDIQDKSGNPLSENAQGRLEVVPGQELRVVVFLMHETGVSKETRTTVALDSSLSGNVHDFGFVPNATTATYVYYLTVPPSVSAGDQLQPYFKLDCVINADAGHWLRTDYVLSDAFDLEVKEISYPTVASVSPTHGAADVSINSVIYIDFSEPMNATSVEASGNITLKMADGTVVPGTVNYLSGIGNVRAEFIPDQNLYAPETYTLTIKGGAGGVRDIEGQYLQSDYTSTFTTQDGVQQTTIEFAGHTWNVKSGTGGPGPNNWSNSNNSVWVDNEGKLHLKIRYINGKWVCAEIYSQDH